MSDRLYFAYGSNLSLSQMAMRCPNSSFHGRAVLPDYRWQINQRGFANIVPCAGYSVHGLVYKLGNGDEERLDRYKGVRSGSYSKVLLPMVLFKASNALQVPTTHFVNNGGAAVVVRKIGKAAAREKDGRMEAGVLVYASNIFVQPGGPRDEYQDRMNRGIKDGLTMGIPASFFNNAIREYIPERATSNLRQGRRRLSHGSARIDRSRDGVRSRSVSRVRRNHGHTATDDNMDTRNFWYRDSLSHRPESVERVQYQYSDPSSTLARGEYVDVGNYKGNVIIRTVHPHIVGGYDGRNQ